MKLFKKMTSAFTVFTALMVGVQMVPQKAQAGIISAIGSIGEMGDDTASGALALALSGGIIVGGIAIINNCMGTVGEVIGITLLVLDADASSNRDDLANAFAVAYPAVDNLEALDKLALTVTSKIPAGARTGEKFMISVPEQETRASLVTANISKAQIQKIVNDLK